MIIEVFHIKQQSIKPMRGDKYDEQTRGYRFLPDNDERI